jgi:hypothetical protein
MSDNPKFPDLAESAKKKKETQSKQTNPSFASSFVEENKSSPRKKIEGAAPELTRRHLLPIKKKENLKVSATEPIHPEIVLRIIIANLYKNPYITTNEIEPYVNSQNIPINQCKLKIQSNSVPIQQLIIGGLIVWPTEQKIEMLPEELTIFFASNGYELLILTSRKFKEKVAIYFNGEDQNLIRAENLCENVVSVIWIDPRFIKRELSAIENKQSVIQIENNELARLNRRIGGIEGEISGMKGEISGMKGEVSEMKEMIMILLERSEEKRKRKKAVEF